MTLGSRYLLSMNQADARQSCLLLLLLWCLWASCSLLTAGCRYDDLPVVPQALPSENRTEVAYGNGRSVAYSCRRGFKVSSGTNLAVCLQDSNGTLQWTAPTLLCVLEECGDPPDLFHAEKGRIEGRGAPYPVGTKALYMCLSGYYKHEGTDIADCIMDGEGKVHWTKPTIDCRAENCGDPGQVKNAERSGHLFTHPHHVTYTCNRGYFTQDKTIIYCLPGAVWSDQLPICELVHCPYPDDVENGQVRVQETSYQSVAVYSCSRGYLLQGDRERHCTSFGNWSGSTPKCTEVHCKPFFNLSGGEIVFGKGLTSPGSIVIMKCYEPDERRSLKCTDAGDWNAPPPVCKVTPTVKPVVPTPDTTASTPGVSTQDPDSRGGSRCEFPGDIHHGSLVVPQRETSFPAGVNLTFQCDQGYKLKGQATLRCLHTGEWQPGRLPACDKVVPVSLIIGLTIGMVSLVALAVVAAVFFVRKRKLKAQEALGLKRKANSVDARDSEETHCLEREKKPIPVTSL